MRQNIDLGLLLSGIAGIATSMLHKLNAKRPVTFKSAAIDCGLAACSMFGAYIVCDLFQLTPEVSRAVYFGAGWIGSRVIAAVDRRSDQVIEQIIDKAVDRIEL
ncbi:MAG: hypothetical protein HGB01_10780 [Chlorobiaceae bacterium]|nr:hypothetical protein [Chlorobiaceae bacterium]